MRGHSPCGGCTSSCDPHRESKLVRCTAGRIFDVIVDLRPDASTFGHWAGHTIDAAEGRAVYVPRGMAHGFLTLAPDSEVLYQISVPYEPTAAAGVRWDDPDLAIAWPARPTVISERDAALPSLDDFRSGRAAGAPRVADDRAAFEAVRARHG